MPRASLVRAPVLAAVAVTALGLGALACQEPAGKRPAKGKTEKTGDVIAEVGDTVLTVEDVQKRLDEQSPFVRARYADADKKKEFLDAQIRFEVLAEEALERGYDADPEVQDAVKKIIVQKLTREEFDGRVKSADVTDAELQKYFDAHLDEYSKPEMARASVIVVAFGADKAAARKKIEDAQKKAADKSKLEDRNAYRDLVVATSTDEGTKRAGGDIRYVTRGDVKERYGDAAEAWLFAQETLNEVSPVLEGKDAFVVLKRTGKRKAITRTFDQVKNQIKNVVFRDKRQESFEAFVAELKKKHGVKVHEDKLAKVTVSAEVPMMPPGGAGHDGHGHGTPGAPMDEGEEGGEGGDEQDGRP
jgi:peptidyl-prolyl cis-trans isomerase C